MLKKLISQLLEHFYIHLPVISDPIDEITWDIWNAISLVGVKINACTHDTSISTISKAVMPKTKVLPVPDLALTIRSIKTKHKILVYHHIPKLKT